MGFLSSSLGKKCKDKHKGSKYYKREGLFDKLSKMFGSNSSYSKKLRKHYSSEDYYRRSRRSSWS